MRIESSVTSISWIPSEAIKGMFKMPFEMGVAHYDDAPPDVIGDLEALRLADRFRFANELRAWIEVVDGHVVDAGYSGKGHTGSTTLSFGVGKATVAGVGLPDRQPKPEINETSARFAQTAGGRTGVPVPRRVKYPPFIQISAPLAWTTLGLTIHADGRVKHDVVGASPFPRHWIYDADGKLAKKTGLIDFKSWYTKAFGGHSPWGDEDSPALVTEVETALERELSQHIMKAGASPKISKVAAGKTLVEQGDPGHELFLLLDGVLGVEVGGEKLVDLGPGAVLGERALIEGDARTATLRAVTPCRVAVVTGDQIDPAKLAELASGHRREEISMSATD
jgi:hypothetical protein